MTIVYTDGSCYPNPGPGGWAFYVPELQIEQFGGMEGTTNNRMELLAVLKAVQHLESMGYTKLEIVSDSKYVVQGVGEWVHGWHKKNWIKSDGKPVINRDMWMVAHELVIRLDITMTWVKGHAGHKHNEHVDELAGRGRESLQLISK